MCDEWIDGWLDNVLAMFILIDFTGYVAMHVINAFLCQYHESYIH